MPTASIGTSHPRATAFAQRAIGVSSACSPRPSRNDATEGAVARRGLRPDSPPWYGSVPPLSAARALAMRTTASHLSATARFAPATEDAPTTGEPVGDGTRGRCDERRNALLQIVRQPAP